MPTPDSCLSTIPLDARRTAVWPEEISGRPHHGGLPVEEPGPSPDSMLAHESPAAARLSEEQLEIGLAKLDALRRWRQMKDLDSGLTIFRATALLGMRGNALWKIIRRAEVLEAQGRTVQPADLAPRGRPAAKRQPAGSLAAWALQQPAFTLALETLYAATLGAASDYSSGGRRTGSVSTALLRVAEESCCPEDLAIALKLGKQPKPLVAHLRRKFTPEVEARLRGEKHFQLHGLISRRDHTVRLPDGRRCELMSGFLVEFDDMSVNQPFYVEQSDGTFILSRQGLYARDLRSRRWLGVELVARPREAYRAEDILRFLRRLMTDYGRFDVLRLEHGVWAARSIQGFSLADGDWAEEEAQRPEMCLCEQRQLQHGLAAIGVHLDYARDAHDKVIENGFNYFQTVLATYTTDFVNIGRHAGEFETAAKRLRQARAGSRNPKDLGFAPMDALADRVQWAFAFINRKGATPPDQVWQEDIEKRPLPSLTPEDLAAFLPETREAVIHGGRVSVTVRKTPHDFRAQRLIELGHGYRVFVRFDPSEPTLGAAIYNRETGSANFDSAAQGGFLCFAQWEMPAPQVDLQDARGLDPVSMEALYGVSTDGRAAVRNAQEAWVRTAYRSLPRPGRPAVQVAEARDGQGRVARAERGTQIEIVNRKSEIVNPEAVSALLQRRRNRFAELAAVATGPEE